ncbi:hypothetical protein OGAPHI_003746 [Ogataea philodendri]|uniref:Uncharacterized protein n=1 Tax=Ogataea philodendri TaxID=1378263 RepID=A0A9P8P5W8_9ASCO|nr:uncharacterized protein OGAPHI_003746 [Ogataea philodendri]KAH3665559.1 hypothetical protein OGAPHI_003746 [Ogataea philodendri]
MTVSRLRVRNLQTSWSCLKSNLGPDSVCFTKVGSARDPRLQTAVSLSEEYSTISQQRLDDLMVPKFC